MEGMNRENAKKVILGVSDLEKCVEELIEYRKEGKSVYIEFQGEKLYSCDVTMDKAFKTITGRTKAEHDIEVGEYTPESAEYFDTKTVDGEYIKDYIDKGKKYVEPELQENWERCVKVQFFNKEPAYGKKSLDISLGIMELMEKEATVKEMRDYLEKEIDNYQTEMKFSEFQRMGMERGIAGNLVSYAKKGVEFAEKTGLYGNRKFIEERKKIDESIKARKSKSPLQEREERLSQLEGEAKKISQALDQQKEEPNIGDE